MSKKNKDVEVVMEVDGKQVETENVETKPEVKGEKSYIIDKNNNKSDKNKDKKKKKDQKPKTNKVKEMFGELKRVTWPSFGTVLAKTGVVLAVVVFFFVVLFGIDWLMSLLYKLLTKTM